MVPMISTECSFWFSCVQAFELATGDYLFDPQAGATFSREEGWSPASLCPISLPLLQHLLSFQTISLTSSSCWDTSLPSLRSRGGTRSDTSTARVKFRRSRAGNVKMAGAVNICPLQGSYGASQSCSPGAFWRSCWRSTSGVRRTPPSSARSS